jgi:16S rRNA (uracil1498-N3)-methyltransferase
MDYFYCPPENIRSTSLTIDGEEFAHLVHVMRAKEGDEIRVVDGKGTAYDVRLGEIRKKMVEGTIHHVERNHNEPPFALTLAVGVLKNPSKFDFLVEKATELGVRTIIPMSTSRTLPHHAKGDRWQKLALAAMKQCGRSYLPEVRQLTAFDDVVRSGADAEARFIAHEQEIDGAAMGVSPVREGTSVIVLVGPEGGFTDEEILRAKNEGYVPVYLGERRLRTETAAIVVCASLSTTS